MTIQPKRGYLKNVIITAFANIELLKREGLVVITCNGIGIVHFPTEKTFAEFQTNGTLAYNGHKFAKVKKFKYIFRDLAKNHK